MRITMVSSAPWCQVAPFLDLCYVSRGFCVKVDPTGLAAGVHTARIRAYDSANINKGTLFEVPVTVVQPDRIDCTKSNVFTIEPTTFKAGAIHRQFLVVPPKATWAILRLRSPNSTATIPARFMVHTLQLVPQRYCKQLETQKVLSVANESATVHAFKCLENNVLEVCIAKLWSHIGDARLEASVEFRGLYAGPSHTMHSASGIQRINIAAMQTDDALPAVQLKTAVMVLKPSESKCTPLTAAERDVIPNGQRQIYQQIFTYSLNLAKAQEVALYAPLFSDVLYESEYESQFWLLFDANKMQVGCGDAGSKSSFIKLEKGDYVVRLQVRHEKREALEKIAEATMLAKFKLATPLSLDCYLSYKEAVQQGKKCTTFLVGCRAVRPIYIAPLANEK